MVKRNSTDLDDTFHALANPTRRHMLRMLARRDRRVSELAAPHDISLPAISKHLGILERAGLIGRMRDGRFSIIRLRTPPLKKALRWIGFYEASWTESLETLEDVLAGRRR